jgi:FSR family fosmidomycin resistance protein-like MFS transporter
MAPFSPEWSWPVNTTAQPAVAAHAASPHTQEGRFQGGRVLTVSLGHALHDTYTGFLAPLLPAFIENLALTNAEAGLLDAFIRWPSLLQPAIGYLADRASLRILFILAPALSAATMSLLGVAPSYATLALLLLLTGASSASLHAVGPAIAGHLSGAKLGRGMSFWMVGGELGRTLGPIVVVTAVRWLTLQGMPWLMVAGLLGSALLYLQLKDVPDRVRQAAEPPPWREALQAMRPLLLPLAGFVVARAFMLVSLTTYLPLLLHEEGVDLWLAGAALTVLEAAGVAGALLGGSISDRLGRRAILVASTLLTPALMWVFLGAQGWTQIPLLLLLGFSLLSVTPVLMALVQETDPQNRALANGIYMATTFVLRTGVVVAVGVLGDRYGQRTAFGASAIVALLGLPLIFLLPGKRAKAA